mmetsp:Transcript_13212/g.25676  ORF Transcript_13212/g.25676 Transcript_13212/m.25676 type:complete len:347 (+) Transcript_13212:55-1095(+)
MLLLRGLSRNLLPNAQRRTFVSKTAFQQFFSKPQTSSSSSAPPPFLSSVFRFHTSLSWKRLFSGRTSNWSGAVAAGGVGGAVLLACTMVPSFSGAEQNKTKSPILANSLENYLNPEWVLKKYTAPVVGITLINLAVFLMWRVPKFQPMMYRHFTSSYHGVMTKRRWHTLITCVFSHKGGFHFLFNTMCMTSLSPIICMIVGAPQFVAFYLGAGLFSSLTSLGFQAAVGRLILRVGNTQAAAAFLSTPGLGASGSVLGLFAISASIFPQNSFILLFLPMFPIEAGTLWPALVVFDICGCIYTLYRHSPIGHAAHLGGSLAGWLYYHYYLKTKNRAVVLLRRRGILRQ